MFVDPGDSEIVLPDLPVPTRGFSSFWENVQAGWQAEIIETDYWNRRGREEMAVYDEILTTARSALGDEAVNQRFHDAGLMTTRLGGRTLVTGPAYQQVLFGMMDDISEDLFGAMPRDAEGVRSVAMERLDAEYRDVLDVLEHGGRGSGLAEFMGRGPIAVTDEMSLILAPLGAAGSLPRVIAAEALVGAVSEAAIIPRMQDVAEEIDAVQNPNPLTQIALGAAFSGALAGGIGAFARGVSYARWRNGENVVPPGVPNHIAADAVADAEDALTLGDPIPQPVQADEGPIAPPLEAYEGDLVPDDGLPQRPTREEIDQEIEMIRREEPELSRNRPTLDRILEMGGVRWNRVNTGTGETELTPLAQELLARGVERQQLLRYMRRDGMADVDNIVATEFADGGTSRLDTDTTGMYLDRDQLVEAMIQEISGTPAYRTAEAAAAAQRIQDLEDDFASIRAELDETARTDGLPEADFEGDYFAPPADGEDGLARTLDIEEAVLRYSDGQPEALPSDIQYGAMAHLTEYGGSVEDAVQRAWMDRIEEEFYGNAAEFEARSAEALAQDIPDAGGRGADGTAAQRVDGNADVATGRVGATERTDAGEQALIPGVEPVSQRQRLEAAQNAPKRGGDKPADMGLFDTNSRLQRDMFDDPLSSEAMDYADRLEAEIRADEEFAALEVEGDVPSPRDTLAELEADRDHLAAIEACQLGRTR